MNKLPPAAQKADQSPTDETSVELGDVRHRTPGALPHERDQQAVNQGADAGQHQSDEAQSAYEDARRGRPDTSAAPQLQQPSPAQRQRKRT